MQVDDTLDGSGAVVIPDDCPKSRYSSWGEEVVSTGFKQLQSPPQIDIPTQDYELQLDDLELDLDTMLKIQERAKAKLDISRVMMTKESIDNQNDFSSSS